MPLWQMEYMRGTAMEMYAEHLSSAFNGLTFPEAAEWVVVLAVEVIIVFLTSLLTCVIDFIYLLLFVYSVLLLVINEPFHLSCQNDITVLNLTISPKLF